MKDIRAEIKKAEKQVCDEKRNSRYERQVLEEIKKRTSHSGKGSIFRRELGTEPRIKREEQMQ
jgi:hypothetical protein